MAEKWIEQSLYTYFLLFLTQLSNFKYEKFGYFVKFSGLFRMHELYQTSDLELEAPQENPN